MTDKQTSHILIGQNIPEYLEFIFICAEQLKIGSMLKFLPKYIVN